MHSYKVADGLFLVGVPVSAVPKGAVPVIPKTKTNHILVVDCSGSMSGELPAIRTHMKTKLVSLLKDDDTLSIVWFSGRGQYGTLLEAEPVHTLADLKAVHEKIDRWLKPVGMTGFKEPLLEVAALIDRIGKTRPGSAFSLFFLSDGCDNQWARGDVLAAVQTAARGLTSATFVEHGYYADRPLLTAMAEQAGGSLIHSESFVGYEAAVATSFGKQVADKKIGVQVNADVIGGFGFTMADGDLATHAHDNGAFQVPENTSAIWFLSPASIGKEGDLPFLSHTAWQLLGITALSEVDVFAATYAAVSLFTTRMRSDIVLPLLKALGDVSFIERFGACFGKQKYSAFMAEARDAAFKPALRWQKGFDPTKVPRDDAYTVLDLLKLLAADESNRLLLDDPRFVYNRIGRASLDASEHLSEKEQAEVAQLTAELAKTKDAKVIAKLSARLAELTAGKQEALRFVGTDAADGYAVSALVYNEDRPNVSVRVQKQGTIDLTSRLPAELSKRITTPTAFPSFIWRTYTIVKDGLINVDTLPVRLSAPSMAALKQLIEDGDAPADVALFETDGATAVLNLGALPIINRKMVKQASAKALFEKEYALTKARAAQKVYKALLAEKGEKASKVFEAMYGADATAWLKEQGITDAGFHPKTVKAPPTDVYNSKELTTALAGLSSLPKVKDVQKRLADKGKLTASMAVMATSVAEVDAFLASDVYKKAKDPDKLLVDWLEGQTAASIAETRQLLREMAEIKFAVVVGQTWFTEFASLDENQLTITADGNDIVGTVTMREVEVAV